MRRIHVNTARQYADLFWPEFVVVDDCVFLKSEWEINPHLYDRDYPTQSESDMSHTHVLDLVQHGAGLEHEPWFDEDHPDFVAACQLGKTMCRMWAAKLLLDFPQDDFRVYFHGFDPIVRFHKIRSGVQNLMEDEHCADRIRDGSILIVDTRQLRDRNTALHGLALPRRP
jgi:hypothetical protein